MACKIFSRREILRGFGLGLAGLSVGMTCPVHAAKVVAALDATAKGGKLLWTPLTGQSNVSLVKGNDRREITYQSLKMIEADVLGAIGDKKRILIKPNFVTTDVPLCATHVDAVRAILDFLKPHFKGEITIGESTASGKGTFDGFKNYGYTELVREYGVKLADLNKGTYINHYVFGGGNKPLPIRLIDTFVDPGLFIISAAKLKTHDRVVTTLSLKNVLLAAPLNDYKKSDKWQTHTQNNFKKDSVLHYNLFHLAQKVWPGLSVIDGFEGMEGNGPVGGTPVDSRIAVASTDPLAADKVATTVMGFDPEEILYMRAMTEAGMGQGDMGRINVLGNTIDQCRMKFELSKKLQEAYG